MSDVQLASARVSRAEYQNARLVRYYTYTFGFRTILQVGGDGLADLPHLLVWGGEGTRMDADIAAMLKKWGPALRRELRAGVPAQ